MLALLGGLHCRLVRSSIITSQLNCKESADQHAVSCERLPKLNAMHSTHCADGVLNLLEVGE